MGKVTIQTTPNGPYKVSGDKVTVLDSEGKDVTKSGDMFLCRCGGSTTKPFCDGTHSKIGFKAAKAAVAKDS